MTAKVNRILIPFSGGIDSTACACMAKRTHKEAHIALAHIIITTHPEEGDDGIGETTYQRAKYIARRLRLPLKIVGHICMMGQPVALQGLFVNWITAVATAHHYDQVWWGFNYYNSAGFDVNYRWDELAELISSIHHSEVRHFYPVLHMTRKEELRTIPEELWERTISCNQIQDGKACGRCNKCQASTEAIQGLRLAQVRRKRWLKEEQQAIETAAAMQPPAPTTDQEMA